MPEVPPLGDVSRETAERLELYEGLLRKWTRRINLVAPASLAAFRARHLVDSAQLLALEPDPQGLWADLGSGGGLPGAVIAILAAERAPQLRVVCVESDQRKAAFLRTVSRETSVPFEVAAERIETLPPLSADIVSARALAPLPKLLGHVAHHLAPEGRALLPKGAKWRDELADAQNLWQFSCETTTSGTEAEAVILSIGDLRRV